MGKFISILPLPVFGTDNAWSLETECVKLREEVTELQAEAKSISAGEGCMRDFWSEWWDCAQVLVNIADIVIDGNGEGFSSYYMGHKNHIGKMRNKGFIPKRKGGD